MSAANEQEPMAANEWAEGMGLAPDPERLAARVLPQKRGGPPQDVFLRWCPVCRRDDRFVHLSISGTHMAHGRRCSGKPIKLTYALVGGWPDADA